MKLGLLRQLGSVNLRAHSGLKFKLTHQRFSCGRKEAFQFVLMRARRLYGAVKDWCSVEQAAVQLSKTSAIFLREYLRGEIFGIPQGCSAPALLCARRVAFGHNKQNSFFSDMARRLTTAYSGPELILMEPNTAEILMKCGFLAL